MIGPTTRAEPPAAGLDARLESLVLRDELPAEVRGIYDQTVLMLAQTYE